MPTIQGTDGDTTGIVTSSSSDSAWTLVEEKVILVDSQSYDFVDVLNGDLEEDYKIKTNVKGGVGSVGGILTLKLNDLDTNQSASGVGRDDGVGAAGDPFPETRSGMVLGYVPVAGRRAVSESTLFAKTGSDRMMLSQAGIASIGRSATFSSTWLDTAINITKLTVFSSVAAGLGVGTVLELYKKTIPT